MIIAITAHGQDSKAMVDSRFGRADYFVLFNEETDEWSVLSNTQNIQAAHGAGIQAGQNLVQSGAGALITGHVGPKAFKVLQAAKISMYSTGELYKTVEEALAAFQAGKLTAIDVPNGLEMKK